VLHLRNDREGGGVHKPRRIFVAFIGVGGLKNQRSIDVTSKTSGNAGSAALYRI
jgi:hypothetical protein